MFVWAIFFPINLNHIFLKWFEPDNKKKRLSKKENSERKVSQVWNVTTQKEEQKKFLNTGTDHLTYLSRKKRKSNFPFFSTKSFFGKFFSSQKSF